MQGPPPLDEKVGKMGKATLMGVVLQKIELGPPASARLLPPSCRRSRCVCGVGGAGGSSEDLQGPYPGQPHSSTPGEKLARVRRVGTFC